MISLHGQILKLTYAFFSIKWINALASPLIVTFTLAIACNSIITKSCNYITLVIRDIFFISIEGYNLTWTWISVVIVIALAGTIISTKSLRVACGIWVARNYFVVEKKVLDSFDYYKRYKYKLGFRYKNINRIMQI